MFDPKTANEIKDYGFNFTDELVGQTISSMTVNATLIRPSSGTSTLTITNKAIVDGYTTFFLNGGAVDDVYRVNCIGTISDGRILEMFEHIQIK